MLALDQLFEVGDRIEVEGSLASGIRRNIVHYILTQEETLLLSQTNTMGLQLSTTQEVEEMERKKNILGSDIE